MITELTQAQRDTMPRFVEKWTKIGLSTEQIPHAKMRKIVQDVVQHVLKRDVKPVIVTDGPASAWTATVALTRADPSTIDPETFERAVREVIADPEADHPQDANYRAVQDAVRNPESFLWPYLDGHWSAAYLSTLDFYASIGVALPEAAIYYMATQDVDVIYPIKHWAVVSCRPLEIHRNAQGQLHKDGGPAVRYKDGWSLWALNGVVVSQEIAETRSELLPAKLALEQTNVEVRREIIRKIGAERFIQEAGAKRLDKCGNYEVLSVDLSTELRDCRYLKMLNPSIGVWHVEEVGPECKTVEEALRFRAPEAMQKIPVSKDGEEWYQQGDVCIWPTGAKALKPRPSKLT